MDVWVISSLPLFQHALEALLTSLPGISVREGARSLNDFLNQPREKNPGIAVWFLSPEAELDTLSTIQAQHLQARVLCLAFSWTPTQAREALRAGAAGCLDADATREELAQALRQASRGEVALSLALQRSLILDWAAHKARPETSHESITPREREVLAWVCQGLSNKQIAQRLYLSVRTVENHLSNIYGKLNVNSRTEAAVIALQNKWVELPSL